MEEKELTDEDIAQALLQNIEYGRAITYFDKWGNHKSIMIADIIDFINRLQAELKSELVEHEEFTKRAQTEIERLTEERDKYKELYETMYRKWSDLQEKEFDFETLKSIVGESDFRTYLKVRITLLWNRFYKYEDRSVLHEIDVCRSILEQDLNGWNSYDYE